MRLLLPKSRSIATSAFRSSNLATQTFKQQNHGDRFNTARLDDSSKEFTVDRSKQDWAVLRSNPSKSWAHIHTSEPTVFDKRFPLTFLRDSCTCPKCVDPNSTQKNFNTAEIPDDIAVQTWECSDEALKITWRNDIPGYEDHITHIPRKLFQSRLGAKNIRKSIYEPTSPILWSKEQCEKLQRIEYEEYMKDDQYLFTAVKQLRDYGLLFLKNVPLDEKSVEKVATRIGNLRHTFYGETWDVKSKPAAKNVAYTKKYLGLHMDLLYMREPPGYQFLHCLKNASSGGAALFSDSFNALFSLTPEQIIELSKTRFNFKYDNDGQNYSRTPVFAERLTQSLKLSPENISVINYSPPFQGPLPVSHGQHESRKNLPQDFKALRAFVEATENEKNLVEYRYEEGDCVIFNNRRVLHGRREFDPDSGERWLKGCYIDSDVLSSKLRVLSEKYEPWYQSSVIEETKEFVETPEAVKVNV